MEIFILIVVVLVTGCYLGSLVFAPTMAVQIQLEVISFMTRPLTPVDLIVLVVVGLALIQAYLWIIPPDTAKKVRDYFSWGTWLSNR